MRRKRSLGENRQICRVLIRKLSFNFCSGMAFIVTRSGLPADQAARLASNAKLWLDIERSVAIC